MVEVLTAVIILLTGQQTATLTCGYPPPGLHWEQGRNYYGGFATTKPPHIWLQRCDLAYKRTFLGLEILGHEILHIIRPSWSHLRIRKEAPWYGNVVVKRWLNRIDP